MNLTRREFAIASTTALLGPALSPSAAQGQRLPPVRDVPWLGEIQTPPPARPADAPRLDSPLANAQGERLKTLAEWHTRRTELRQAWLNLLGTWPAPRRPLEFEIIETDRSPDMLRRLIRYPTEWGVSVEAYLLTPKRFGARLPAVVVFHSTVDYTIRQGAGLEGPAEAAWGLKLAQRGFVALCPRCFLWNSSQTPDYRRRVAEHHVRHPDSLGMAKMLNDGQRAVDLLASLPEVDPQRIGAAGHSLGAKEVLYLAAFDERIKAAVSSEGGIGTTFSNWDAPWYLGSKQFGREHHELLALAAPRPFLLIGGDSADGARSWPFVASALEIYRLYGQPCRVGLYNHRAGHAIPPLAEARTYEWLQTYL